MSVLPSYKEQQVRQHMAYRQAEDYIFEHEIKPRINAQIIEEHQRRPIGKHSDNLERVLVYLRNHHMMMEGKYILVCTKPHEEWRIAQLQDEPDSPPELLDDTFADRYAAEHGLFLKRLRDNGLMPEGIE